MNYLYLIFSCLTVISCKAKQDIVVEEEQHFNTTDCPEDGTCTFELLPNKSIKTLHDNLGDLYIEIVEGNALVLKFEYKCNEIPNTMDGQYVEQIIMELDPNNLELELKDELLQNVKMLFARFCYCKGETGYYRVKQGELTVKKATNNTYQLNLSFKIDEVPQIIIEISDVISHK